MNIVIHLDLADVITAADAETECALMPENPEGTVINAMWAN